MSPQQSSLGWVHFLAADKPSSSRALALALWSHPWLVALRRSLNVVLSRRVAFALVSHGSLKIYGLRSSWLVLS